MSNYSKDPCTKSYGAERIRKILTSKYGQRYIDYRTAWDKADNFILPVFPLNLTFDPTNLCNLNCPQCYRSSTNLPKLQTEFFKGKKMLSLKQITKVLDEAQLYALPSVNVGGSGEPTIHPRFNEICSIIMEHDVIEFRIVSNGLLLTKETCESLIKDQVHMLSISIDANSRKTYGAVRGMESGYQKVIDNVMLFLKLRKKRESTFPLLRTTFALQPANAHEVDNFIKRWTKLADMVEVQAFHPWELNNPTSDFSCTQPWKRLNIWADGKIGPCCSFTGMDYVVGKLGQPLKDIWTGEKINRIRKMILKRQYAEPCLKCFGSVRPLEGSK